MYHRLLPAIFSLLLLSSIDSKAGGPTHLGGYEPMFIKQSKETLKRRKKKKGPPLNLKLLPAFYWNTIGIEAEYTLAPKFTVGINLLGTLGRLDGSKANFTQQPEDFMREGYRGEIALKYYIKGEAPTGFYAYLNGAYNTMFYHDGNTRPYTLHNRWKEIQGLRLPADFKEPSPISAGLGVGYQMVVIPGHIIANALVVVQGHMDASSNPFIAVYVAPSVGWKF